MLCQIEKCARYAQEHFRTLVIDTFRTGFADDFGYFFVPKAPWIIMATPENMAHMNTLATFPECLRGNLDTYPKYYSEESRNFEHSEYGTLLSFDFNKVYKEPLLIHDTCGGGDLSFSCMKRFTVSDVIKEHFYSRLAMIGNSYAGIHVRHTDRRTDYITFFNQVREMQVIKPILLCSDSLEVIEYGREFFGESIFTFSAIPDNGGNPLHYDHTLNRRQVNMDSLLDLLMLAHSRALYATKVDKGSYSGFTRLADYLHREPRMRDILFSRSSVQPLRLN